MRKTVARKVSRNVKNEPITYWYISLALNTVAGTVSHALSTLVYDIFKSEGLHVATGMTVLVVFMTITIVYVVIYSFSGYVPLGKINEGLCTGSQSDSNRR